MSEIPVHTGYQSFKGKKRSKALLPPTSGDILGPYYKADAPFTHLLTSLPTFELSGHVTDQHGAPLPAVLDFWQADPEGHYDNAGYQFRGKVSCDSKGTYNVATAKPGDYKISPTESRCAHLHVKVTAPGMKELTTQLYFPGSPHNDTDHWFDPARVLRCTSRSGDRWLFDFVLETE